MDKRNPEAYKLRVYVDAIKDAEKTTDEQWIQNWIKGGGDFVPRCSWIAYLEHCVVLEVERLYGRKAA